MLHLLLSLPVLESVYRGFNDVTAVQNFGAYYQLWSGSTGTVNTGSNGLGKFDYVVSSAKAHGIRLIVSLYVDVFSYTPPHPLN